MDKDSCNIMFRTGPIFCELFDTFPAVNKL